MIVDTSAIVAIVFGESDAARFSQALEESSKCRLSAGSYVELGVVIDGRQDPTMGRRLDEVLSIAGIAIEPVTERQARIAREAYRDYGKGSGHPARLNFGDCFSYALARDLDEPLLFKGDDFRHTDVTPAL